MKRGEGVKIEGLKRIGVNYIIMVIYTYFYILFIIEYIYLFESFSRFLGNHDLSVTKKS